MSFRKVRVDAGLGTLCGAKGLARGRQKRQRPHVRIVPGAWLVQAVFQREREAKEYWDSLTEAQEVWALRKMGYFKIG